LRGESKGFAYRLAVVGACALALALRLPALAPSDLWLDDQWVAVLVRDASFSELVGLAPPVPFGFILALKAVTAWFGETTLALQALPFLAGILLVPATAACALQITGSRAAAAMAAVFVAGDPDFGTYAARLKPFTIDALATVLVVRAFVVAMRRPSGRALATLGATAAAALPFSFAALFPGVVFVHLAAFITLFSVMRARPRDSTPLVRGALYGCLLFDYVAFAVLWVALRGGESRAIVHYWQKFYLPLDSLGDAWAFLVSKGVVIFADSVPGVPPRAIVVLAAVGWVALVASRRTRDVAVGIAALFSALLVASALHLYPAGGVRTDLFTHPLSALLAATCLHAFASLRPSAGNVARALLLVIACAGVFAMSARAIYPRAGDREVVEHAAATIGSNETMFIYPWSSWAVALYATWPVTLRAAPSSTNGFYAFPLRERSVLLDEGRDGLSFLTSADVARPQIAAGLGDELPPRVHLLATRIEETALAYIRRAIEERGYIRASSYEQYRATFDTFERGTPLDGSAGGAKH
jgi:hypothetical protein